MPDRPLAGRVALVTGANHGIGAATAAQLARLGASVGITYLRLHVPEDQGNPDAYREQRRQCRDHVHVVAPDEVATVIGWLCTDAAQLVTGNVIRLR